jgi:chromosome segregation ATPase
MSSEDPLMHDPPKSRATEVLTYVAIAVIMFAGGMLLESRLASQSAAEAKHAFDQQYKQLTDKALEEQKKADADRQALTDTLAKEREEHEKTVQTKDKSIASVSRRASGMRTALEADLSAARTSGEACTSRIAGISEALGGLFDSVGEVAGIAQDLGRENQQLKEDNRSLSAQVVGWQKWNSERAQKVTVVGQKNG